MLGDKAEVTRLVRDLLRASAELDAADQAHIDAEREAKAANEAWRRARDLIGSALEPGESVIVDGHLIRNDDGVEIIEIAKAVRLD